MSETQEQEQKPQITNLKESLNVIPTDPTKNLTELWRKVYSILEYMKSTSHKTISIDIGHEYMAFAIGIVNGESCTETKNHLEILQGELADEFIKTQQNNRNNPVKQTPKEIANEREVFWNETQKRIYTVLSKYIKFTVTSTGIWEYVNDFPKTDSDIVSNEDFVKITSLKKTNIAIDVSISHLLNKFPDVIKKLRIQSIVCENQVDQSTANMEIQRVIQGMGSIFSRMHGVDFCLTHSSAKFIRINNEWNQAAKTYHERQNMRSSSSDKVAISKKMSKLTQKQISIIMVDYAIRDEVWDYNTIDKMERNLYPKQYDIEIKPTSVTGIEFSPSVKEILKKLIVSDAGRNVKKDDICDTIVQLVDYLRGTLLMKIVNQN